MRGLNNGRGSWQTWRMESAVSTLDVESRVTAQTKPDPATLARMVLREGKTFKDSALGAGYSLSVANAGLKVLLATSKRVSDAFRIESEKVSISLDKLKPLAVNRLYQEIINPDSSNGMKAIELAGRFKETDWFVRNAEVTLGVFLGLGEQSPEAGKTDLQE